MNGLKALGGGGMEERGVTSIKVSHTFRVAKEEKVLLSVLA